jgi:hypothetical protein
MKIKAWPFTTPPQQFLGNSRTALAVNFEDDCQIFADPDICLLQLTTIAGATCS